jgi:secondary thiamine-phosphate synthase enzyme
MVKEVQVRSSTRVELINIDPILRDFVAESGMDEGIVTVFVPHTTAAVTINENADPAVVLDILEKTSQVIPERDRYRHAEGNSDAHIKASLFGSQESIIVKGGSPQLGRWQSLFFCEFDGPRSRRVILHL